MCVLKIFSLNQVGRCNLIKSTLSFFFMIVLLVLDIKTNHQTNFGRKFSCMFSSRISILDTYIL